MQYRNNFRYFFVHSSIITHLSLSKKVRKKLQREKFLKLSFCSSLSCYYGRKFLFYTKTKKSFSILEFLSIFLLYIVITLHFNHNENYKYTDDIFSNILYMINLLSNKTRISILLYHHTFCQFFHFFGTFYYLFCDNNPTNNTCQFINGLFFIQ